MAGNSKGSARARLVHEDVDTARATRSLFQKAHDAEVLSAETEAELVGLWKNHGDTKAQQRIVESHMRLVTKMALKMGGYRATVGDLIQEGVFGLYDALNKYDPRESRGARFSTYARQFITAAMTDSVIRELSLTSSVERADNRVKTTARQSSPISRAVRSVFFNAAKLDAQFRRENPRWGREEINRAIAEKLDIPLHRVEHIRATISGGDTSLEFQIQSGRGDGVDAETTLGDILPDDKPDPEQALIDKTDKFRQMVLIRAGLDKLDRRSREIFTAHNLSDKKVPYPKLAAEFGISVERARQIDTRAFGIVAQEARRLSADEAEFRIAAGKYGKPQSPGDEEDNEDDNHRGRGF